MNAVDRALLIKYYMVLNDECCAKTNSPLQVHRIALKALQM
jgi:hypothetical protein